MAAEAESLESASLPHELTMRGGSREVVQLSAALGGMTRRLLQANAELEERVHQRTRELEHANTALERLAHRNPLTGLLNRRGLDAAAVAAMASARRRRAPLSLLLVDADHFKQVNDRHGHDVGDQVLKTIGEALRLRLREVDIVARFGGEEFVVLLPDTGSLGASQAAANLVAAVARTPMPMHSGLTISCGVAEVGTERDDVPAAAQFQRALRRADAALYRAKQSGRNRHCVDAEACDAPSEEAVEPA